jgi:hypothetical protein
MNLNPLNPDQRLSNLEVEEKAANAQAVLNDPTFINAMEDVYSRAEGILLDAEVGSLTAGAAHATMKAIKDIRNQLDQYIADNKMRQKYHKGAQ